MTPDEAAAVAQAFAEARQALDEAAAPRGPEPWIQGLAWTIVETIREPLLVLDRTLRAVYASRSFCATFRVSATETRGQPFHEMGNGQWNIPALHRLLERIIPDGAPLKDYDIEREFPNLGRRVMRLNARRMICEGHPTMLLLEIEDITERRRAEDHQSLLLRELDHRMKNILASLQLIASQTLPGGEATDRFLGRVAALAYGHRLLTQSRGEGVELRVLLEKELAPYRTDDSGRIHLTGDAVVLIADAAQTLGLVLHELATNAAKYGALSVPEGSLEVAWRIGVTPEGRRLALVWAERGGPPVRPPSRRGFGTTLIERGVAYELGGTAVLDFRREGMRCEIQLPFPGKADGPQ